MDLVATIWDATKCLCDCTAKHAAFISHLEENLQSLAEQWTELQNLTQDVNVRVQRAETNPHMRRTKEVDGWLQSVNYMEQTIEDIKKRGDKVARDKCLGKFCHKNCLSSYNLGAEIVKAQGRLKDLMDKGQKFHSEANIAYELPREPVDEMPVPNTVGMDLILEKVWDSIEDRNVGIIGLYGMGGAGKTTLMKRINNEFAKRRHDFGPVIWTVVSKDRNIDITMEDIRKKCQIGDINWMDKSRDEKVREIYNVMKQKKFILFLDDIWDKLELHSIGVPLPDETNESKVLFTTRSEDVCDYMRAKKFKVRCLEEKEAFDLFCSRVGVEAINSDPAIPALAEKLVHECKGLPLALITIGRAMAGRKTKQAWEHAIEKLKSSPSEVRGVEEEVFFILKFSFDSLPNTDKDCFLYLAMFPNDYIINVRDLIRLWIGEGLLGEHDNIHSAFDHGEHIVESLKLACLLEDDGERFVKMHDVIRDMALWLFRNQDRNKNIIMVQWDVFRTSQSNNHEAWKNAQRISLIDIDYDAKVEKWHVPICPDLQTLIVWWPLRLSDDFANVGIMRKLKVLSLRYFNGMTTLPAEIGQLIHLEYLELSQLGIEGKFPVEMKNLNKLRVFLLEFVDCSLEIIPLEVISCLKSLRVFLFRGDRLIGRSFDWRLTGSMHRCQSSLEEKFPYSPYLEEELFLEQLELLPLLEELSITLETPTGINKLLSSTKLQRCVRYVGVQPYEMSAINIPIMTSMANMKCLEEIQLTRLQWTLEESSINHVYIFHNLSVVRISDCHSVTHLTWLMHVSHLREMVISNCNQVENVIMETEDNKDSENMVNIFAKLASMILIDLPKLKSVCKKALPCSKLEFVTIMECPNLKNLPLNSNVAPKNLIIMGEAQWWDNLEWEDPKAKNLFQTKFLKLCE